MNVPWELTFIMILYEVVIVFYILLILTFFLLSIFKTGSCLEEYTPENVRLRLQFGRIKKVVRLEKDKTSWKLYILINKANVPENLIEEFALAHAFLKIHFNWKTLIWLKIVLNFLKTSTSQKYF